MAAGSKVRRRRRKRVAAVGVMFDGWAEGREEREGERGGVEGGRGGLESTEAVGVDWSRRGGLGSSLQRGREKRWTVGVEGGRTGRSGWTGQSGSWVEGSSKPAKMKRERERRRRREEREVRLFFFF